MPDDNATIYTQAEQFKAALLKRERNAASQMIRVYGQAWTRLSKLLIQVTEKIGEAQRRGDYMSPAWLFQQERYARLMVQIEREMTKFAAVADDAIKREQAAAVKAALRDSTSIAKTAANVAGIDVSFTQINPSAVESIAGFLSNGAPLRRLLDELPRGAGQAVADALTEGIALGYNPTKIARNVKHSMGMNLTRALTIARTETLRAYREAAHENFRANDDVLQGWIWTASLSRRTCPSCIAMHGTFHPMSERMESHPRCRCVQMPLLKGQTPPLEKGDEWFAKQREDTQRAILVNKATYKAYADGKLKLTDLVGRRQDVNWGNTYHHLSLKRALNGEGKFPGYNWPGQGAPPIASPPFAAPPVVRNYREFQPAPWMSSSSPQNAKEMIIRRYADQFYSLTDYRAQWTAPELRSVQDYVGSWYQPINDYLRGKKSRLKNWNIEDIKFRVKAVDAALSKNELVEDTILFRGANLPTLRSIFDSGEDIVGSVWPEKAYSSTSFNAEISRIFAQSRGMRPVVFRIKANKGTKGAYVSHINREFHPANPDYHNGESEFLLPRNTGLYITGAKYVKLKGRTVLQVEAEIWTEELASTRKAKILTTKRQKTTR